MDRGGVQVIAVLAYLTLAAFVAVFIALLLAAYEDTYGVKWPGRKR